MQDLKGRRIATGAPGSGTEIIAIRILEAYGIDPDKDVTREKLSVAESVNALKDRKIDAFFWSGGVPTAAVTDLARHPGDEDQAPRPRRRHPEARAEVRSART